MSILEVRNIEKSFGETEVLKGIDFSLEKGQVLSIIGSSCSGKTTLLRCLNFLERPDRGQILVNGDLIYDAAMQDEYSDTDIRKKSLNFGLVFQSFNLFPQYTALKNVMLAQELMAKEENPDFKKESKRILAEIEEKSIMLLDQVGLIDKLGNYPHELSGGQQQRVAIARALAMNPEILCFDEPTSALDPELTGEVLNVIQELASRETTMIIVTHEMRFAHDVSDIVLFMDEGVIVEQGAPDVLFNSPREDRTRQFLMHYSE